MADEYKDEKRVMNWGGVGLIIIGIILLFIGITSFIGTFSNFPSLIDISNPETIINTILSQTFWGMGFTMAGGLMLGAGVYLIQIANVRRYKKPIPF